MREYARYEEQDWRPSKDSSGVSVGTVIKWLLVGVGIGAGVALLFTPANGRELRGAIARGYRRAADGISRGTRELRQRGSDLISFNRSHLDQKTSRQG